MAIGKETHLPDKGLDATGTTVGLVKGNLANNLATVIPAIILSDGMSCDGGSVSAVDILAELLDLLDLGRQALGESLLQGLMGSVSISIELDKLDQSRQQHTLTLAEE